MGLTNRSTGVRAADAGLSIQKRAESDRVIALAGNPNVGKSTVFNALTHLRQHTGNWPGKTVCCAQGRFRTAQRGYILVDLPGTYSLMARSAEEEAARSFLCFGGADAAVVVCDATCLERSLNLALQTMELGVRTVVCVNLLDEAKRKHIRIDLSRLADRLGAPVVGTSARKKRTLRALTDALDRMTGAPDSGPPAPVPYPEEIEAAVARILPEAERLCRGRLNARWLCLRLLEQDAALLAEAEARLGVPLGQDAALQQAAGTARAELEAAGIGREALSDRIVSALVAQAERLCSGVVTHERPVYRQADLRIDRVLTSRLLGYPVMLALLAFVFWLTVVGANAPSRILSRWLFGVQDWLTALFHAWGAPEWLHGLLVLGMFRTMAWVVSVMLPPMAIFFPLFTLLEDLGYLPRVAYNLDRPFQRCRACGKQALCMCMSFGCNAAGVVGCRIIDSPRERLLAILTNNFIPCNGRFPMLISLLTIFFIGTSGVPGAALRCALLLTGVIVLGVAMTFAVTRLLSDTLLRGEPSAFTLELPPYRRPQVGSILVRSVLDRTLFVLGRAAAVAAPAGMLLWALANTTCGGSSLLSHCAHFLDPFAQLMGLDGAILLAFVLGFPANEVVVPIIVMIYLSQGSLTGLEDPAALRALLCLNGWTWTTAVSTVLFSLMHWPCSTTLWTVRKETGSWKWTALAAAIPTACGMLCCMAFTALARLFGA